jgi:hypothetical protein
MLSFFELFSFQSSIGAISISTRLKLHSVLTRENPRLLSAYKTDRSNRKQDKSAGLRPGRTIVKEDWDTTAGGPDWDTTASLWPDKTAGLSYGQTRLLGKTILQNYAGLAYQYSHQFASICVDATQIDANFNAT